MANLTEKYLDKELVDSIPEKLPPSYEEWLDTQKPTIEQREQYAKEQQAGYEKLCKRPVF